MAMELLKVHLHHIVVGQGQKLSMFDVCRLGLDLLVILETVHKTGIVYNDLNLANIMFNDKNELKLVDFGCARRYCDGEGTLFFDSYLFLKGNITKILKMSLKVHLFLEVYTACNITVKYCVRFR
jgi:serine/threonine protein kinase